MHIKKTNTELLKVAKRIVWYQSPEVTLNNELLFLSHVMTYGSIEDILITQQHYSKTDFIYTLKHAPAGVFDPRSWAYWHTVLHLRPIPPLPQRKLFKTK